MLAMFYSSFFVYFNAYFAWSCSLGSAKSNIGWDRKLNSDLMASCVRNVRNIHTKNYDYLIIFFSSLNRKCPGCFYETQCSNNGNRINNWNWQRLPVIARVHSVYLMNAAQCQADLWTASVACFANCIPMSQSCRILLVVAKVVFVFIVVVFYSCSNCSSCCCVIIEKRIDNAGRVYFVNHRNRTTQWEDPRIQK